MLRAGVTAFALFLLVTSPGAQTARQSPPDVPATQGSPFADAIAHAAQHDSELQRLYSRQRLSPLWTDEGGAPSDLARDALRVLDFVEVDGLDAADYHTEELQQAFEALTAGRATRAADAPAVARFDVALSRALLDYLHDLRDGRVAPRSAGYVEFDAVAERGDLVTQLEDAIRARQVVGLPAACRPRFAEYDALMIALARVRDRAHARLQQSDPPCGESRAPAP